MGRWAQAPLQRDQITLFAPTLDQNIAPNHPVRFVDEVLARIDFGQWECQYVGDQGQPPIHPRVMAGAILYGLSLGIRSSRQLEQAVINRLDFIWLCQGRSIDHSTICGFRTDFMAPLKDLFRRIGRVAIEMGMVNLNQMALDGTAIRSNNSRYATGRQRSLEEKLAALNQQVEEAMRQAQACDEQEQHLYGSETPARLPRSLADLKKRQQRLQEAMEKLKELQEKREGRKDLSPTGPAVPLTDPDSRVLPNKHGGHAPNYTMVLSTEGQSGLIVDAQVRGDNNEPATVLPAVEHVRENFGHTPGQLLADGNFNSGSNLAGLEQAGVEAMMPPRQSPARENPAERENPTVAVASPQQETLPMNPQNKVLDKSAFVYDKPEDCYFCPQGRRLNYVGNNAYARDSGKGVYRVYECGSCQGCPLAGRCLNARQQAEQRPRRVVRDEYEPLREEMAKRMKSEEGRRIYKRRSFLCETPFAVLRTVMGLGQLLLRGLEKVKTEVLWGCCAYNLRKMAAMLAAGRVALKSVPA
jgi:transposase